MGGWFRREGGFARDAIACYCATVVCSKVRVTPGAPRLRERFDSKVRSAPQHTSLLARSMRVCYSFVESSSREGGIAPVIQFLAPRVLPESVTVRGRCCRPGLPSVAYFLRVVP